MKILVACEESQVVTIAFRNKGHEAYSCDIQECSGGYPEWHIIGDVLCVINGGTYFLTQDKKYIWIDRWDMMIGHPPCTFLSYAGTRHWNMPGRLEKRLDALDFFGKLWNAPIDKICLENPKGCASPTIAKFTQEIQPYYFGDPHIKTTWLWLKNLPKLVWSHQNELWGGQCIEKPEPIYVGAQGKKHYYAQANHGSKTRSKTFTGIANAMADQWS